MDLEKKKLSNILLSNKCYTQGDWSKRPVVSKKKNWEGPCALYTFFFFFFRDRSRIIWQSHSTLHPRRRFLKKKKKKKISPGYSLDCNLYLY